jgi:hypothetical protein
VAPSNPTKTSYFGLFNSSPHTALITEAETCMAPATLVIESSITRFIGDH